MQTTTDPTAAAYLQQTPRRPTIALDLDGCIYDFDGHLRTLYRQMYPDRPVPDSARRWADCVDDFHFDHITHTLQFYTEHQGWLTHPATAELPTIRAMLNHPAHWVIITARPEAARAATHATIERDLGPNHPPILIANKPKYLYGCDLYIDDSPSECEDMAAHGYHHIVFDQPWNRHLPDHWTRRRAHDWTEAAALVKYWMHQNATPARVLPKS